MSFELILPFLRPIEPLLLDDSISEIMGNPDASWWYERDGNPLTGEQLVRHRNGQEYTTAAGTTVKPVEHRAGWDATFSAPKSVSLTALVGGDDRVREAHRQAVTTALTELERYTQARIGGNRAAETTGTFVAAKFEHDTARPVDGYAAPQLHTHAVIFNMTERADGSTRAVQPRRVLLATTDPGDLVFDPTCGSGTTAYVAEQWGRRWITCDTSRVALALARTRLMSARYPFYILNDSPEGIRKEAEITGTIPPPHQTDNDIRKGFVYRRVPHITLGSIANNPEIKQGMSRTEIDAAIAVHSNPETLFDQPHEDNKRIRVSGPFSVESLSPYRVLSTDDDAAYNTASEQEAQKQQDFSVMILDNLRKAGVQNTIKKERLTFETLDPYAGAWLNASGTYTDAVGKQHRVAVSLGPEHGTVGPNQVKEAAKEAVKGIGFDTLVVCGFAFDPHVSEETRRYGNLQVLIARMNPDLSMGNELLKKTGAGNLFMVFGEPEIDLNKQPDGKLTVEIKGIDVYDPTTGDIRSSSTDDIACWFIDTDYNGESFFVRHAYFTGKDRPYDKLKRALQTEIDEAAWASLYSTVSRPFPSPASEKIAVKVINHYGDEVLKVFPV